MVMATVKGDVHDIGKNIVGVVLACNNYEVIDLGVMVPPQKILEDGAGERCRRHRPVGSDHPVAGRDGRTWPPRWRRGLRHPAADRRRDDVEGAYGGEDLAPLPALPGDLRQRRQPRRGRGVVAAVARRSATSTSRTSATNIAEVADRHERAEAAKPRLPLAKARDNAMKIDWSAIRRPKPSFTGAKVIEDWDLAEIAHYIDWTPFFQTWELKGVYPRDPRDEKYGEAARNLFADAQAMLKQIIDEKWFAPPRRGRLLAGEPRWATTSACSRRRPGRGTGHAAHAAPADVQARRAPEPGAGGFRRARRARPTMSAASA